MEFLKAEDFIGDSTLTEAKKTAFDYSVTGMPPRYYNVTFDSYKNKISEEVKKFCVGASGVLFIEGNNGTGKTATLCACFRGRYDAKLPPGLYISSKYTVCPLLRSSRSFSSRETEYVILQRYYSAPFVVIDEVGKGDDKELERTFVSNVLSARYDYGLPTALASNMSMVEFCHWIGEDVKSRLYQTATVLTLTGEDWRKK